MILFVKSVDEVLKMRFSANTTYSYECLLRFSNYTFWKKKWVWITMIAATAIVTLSFLLQFTSIGYDFTLTWSFVGVLILDVLFAFMSFGMPRITLKKSPALNAEITFEFYDNSYKVTAAMPNGKELSELNYTAIKKVEQTDKNIYLFVAQNQAYIVDKSRFSLGTADSFVDFISSKVESQNFLDKRKSR